MSSKLCIDRAQALLKDPEAHPWDIKNLIEEMEEKLPKIMVGAQLIYNKYINFLQEHLNYYPE